MRYLRLDKDIASHGALSATTACTALSRKSLEQKWLAAPQAIGCKAILFQKQIFVKPTLAAPQEAKLDCFGCSHDQGGQVNPTRGRGSEVEFEPAM